MELRPYQSEALAACWSAWEEHRRILAVLPTGTGKTILFAKLSEQEVDNGGRVLILAHREELIQQAADKLARATGLSCAIERGQESAVGSLYLVTVGSVQSMTRAKRLAQFHADDFSLIVVDEAHHVLSDSYQRVLEHFPAAKILGVTATPDRGDKRNLGKYFDTLAYEYHLRQAIADGYLAPITAETIPIDIDLAKVRTVAGDYNDHDLDDALAPYLGAISREMAARLKDRKTLVFLPLCATAQKMRDLLEAAGLRCWYASGQYRDDVRHFEAAGPGVALTNAMLLTEGYDHPPIDAIVCLRPTKVRSLYAQMVGRGTRIHPGKSNLLLLDFLWHSETHELCRPAHLIAETAEMAQEMTEAIDGAGAPLDLEEVETQAKEDARRERESALAKQLAAQRGKKRRSLDPVSFALALHDESLEAYEPAFAWEALPASEAQLGALVKFGFAAEDIPNKGYASKLLDRLIARSKNGLATAKQVNRLQRYGIDAGMFSFEQARATLDGIAGNGWKLEF